MNMTPLIRSLQGRKQPILLVVLLWAALAGWPPRTPAAFPEHKNQDKDLNGALTQTAFIYQGQLNEGGVATTAAPDNCFELLSSLADWDKEVPQAGKERFIQFFLVSNETRRQTTFDLSADFQFFNHAEYIEGRLDWVAGSPRSGAPASLKGEGKQFWNTERWGPPFPHDRDNPFDPHKANEMAVTIPIDNMEPPPAVILGFDPDYARMFVPRCERNIMYGFSSGRASSTMYVVTLRRVETAGPPK